LPTKLLTWWWSLCSASLLMPGPLRVAGGDGARDGGGEEGAAGAQRGDDPRAYVGAGVASEPARSSRGRPRTHVLLCPQSNSPAEALRIDASVRGGVIQPIKHVAPAAQVARGRHRERRKWRGEAERRLAARVVHAESIDGVTRQNAACKDLPRKWCGRNVLLCACVRFCVGLPPSERTRSPKYDLRQRSTSGTSSCNQGPSFALHRLPFDQDVVGCVRSCAAHGGSRHVLSQSWTIPRLDAVSRSLLLTPLRTLHHRSLPSPCRR
jgi:hypothetical protein